MSKCSILLISVVASDWCYHLQKRLFMKVDWANLNECLISSSKSFYSVKYLSILKNLVFQSVVHGDNKFLPGNAFRLNIINLIIFAFIFKSIFLPTSLTQFSRCSRSCRLSHKIIYCIDDIIIELSISTFYLASHIRMTANY